MLVEGERRTFSSFLLKSQMLASYCYFSPKASANRKGNHYGTMKIFCTYGSFTLLPGVYPVTSTYLLESYGL